MAKMKIATLPDDKPVKLTVELPATLHRDLQAYFELLAREPTQSSGGLARLIVAMVTRFMATDRAFAKLRKLDSSERPRKENRS